MTFFFYRPVRGFVQTTLFVAGLSLAVSPELLAEDGPQEELRSLETPLIQREADSRPSGLSGGKEGRSLAAIALGFSGGLVVGYAGGVTVCELAGHGGGAWGLGCLVDNSAVFTVSVLTGIVGAPLGYKNVGPAVVGGGSLFFGVLGSGVGEWPGFFLGATAGGYLGYRVWKARESDGEQYSLLPYWDEERSGVVLSGHF